MSPESLRSRARDLAAEIPLPAEDWEAILNLVQGVRQALQQLDQLPLTAVEPPAVFHAQPGTEGV